ncbi:hypothetical protein Fcan01_26017 [Folsomia candida]|uniref:Uncharacterized protein n=1 Tax=Folsomia candida TaxID=158441 RepID=A0A226D209_FOLCA|nr:hypothetical protein Fcan01_26017 [Folsomia candida]
MAEIGKPKNAYELLGLSAPTAEGAPTATNDKPMLTPELLRRFINLPHMEILWVMFLVTKNPANSDNQPTDYDHMAKQVTQSDFVLGDTAKDLATLQAKSNNLVWIDGSNVHFDNFAWISDMISRNKGLHKIELEKGYDPEKDGKRHTNLREEVADESLLHHMALIGKPSNVYELIGLSAPIAQSDTPATNDKPILTPELLRRFIHLPHVENFRLYFVLSLNPDDSDDQPKDNDHLLEQVYRLTTRFQDLSEARFAFNINSTEGSFRYSITISIDRKTFKGLPP